MTDAWPTVQPAVDWIFAAFEQPVKRLPSAPGEVALDVTHVGGWSTRSTLWIALSHEIKLETGGRFVVQLIGVTTDEAQLLIVAKG
jgi:hypothetical protein